MSGSEDPESDADRPRDGDSDGAGTRGRGRPCPFCGAAMEHRHCEYVCPNHGVVYDCSDTFW